MQNLENTVVQNKGWHAGARIQWPEKTGSRLEKGEMVEPKDSQQQETEGTLQLHSGGSDGKHFESIFESLQPEGSYVGDSLCW